MKLSELLVSRWRLADSAGFCFGGVPGLGAQEEGEGRQCEGGDDSEDERAADT